MNPEQIQMRGGVIAVNGSPFLIFDTVAQAGLFLFRLGYRCHQEGGTFTFWKPQAKPATA